MADLDWVFMGRIKKMLTVLDRIPSKSTHPPPKLWILQEFLMQLLFTFGWVQFFFLLFLLIAKIMYYSFFTLETLEFFLLSLL